jgi:hypothetical protein
MAELIRTQGYRAQVGGVPGAATPSVSFGQQRQPGIEFDVKANYQRALSNTLDRISQSAFGIAEQASQRAGAQFALENQLTKEQLDAMARGDMSTVDLGSPLNAFSATVRKARAIELSGHMEVEARQEMLSLFDKASRGEISTEDAAGKIRGLLDAGGSTLAQVDPDAAYKYRATIATMGGKVIDEIGKTELKRRALINEQKLSGDYRNVLAGIGAYMNSSLPINPETGQEWDLMEVVGKLKENFLTNAFAIGGLPVMQSYAEKIDADIRQLQISTVTRELTKDEYYLNPTQTIKRIYAGDLDDARQAIGSLASDSDAIKNLVANFRSMVTDRRAQRADEEETTKTQNRAMANDLMIEYFRPGTRPSRKRTIASEVASLNVLSIDQLEKFLDPSAARGDPYSQAALEFAISQGEITGPDELLKAANRAGMNGQQYVELNRKLISGVEEDERRAMKYIRDAAGVPDVRGAFVSKDDRHKLDKANRLQEILNEKANLFRQENPGQTVPWSRLARESETQYTQIDGANAKKNQARDQLTRFVDGIKVDNRGRPNKNVPQNLVIDAETNVDDLVRRGIIDQKDAQYVQDRINTLRGVSQ